MRTRLKVCGITNPDDAINAVNAGVDAIGLVFYEKSPRSVTIEQARCVVNSLPPFVT
ncbi:MAG: N-(5'-phosphoribosyl)anthranilate isomerase, partial [Methylococcales bacterium]|nr:N-(5'-phosphoribosyl)anthranilate isomerase [Methylococcales bacterium]